MIAQILKKMSKTKIYNLLKDLQSKTKHKWKIQTFLSRNVFKYYITQIK